MFIPQFISGRVVVCSVCAADRTAGRGSEPFFLFKENQHAQCYAGHN